MLKSLQSLLKHSEVSGRSRALSHSKPLERNSPGSPAPCHHFQTRAPNSVEAVRHCWGFGWGYSASGRAAKNSFLYRKPGHMRTPRTLERGNSAAILQFSLCWAPKSSVFPPKFWRPLIFCHRGRGQSWQRQKKVWRHQQQKGKERRLKTK